MRRDFLYRFRFMIIESTRMNDEMDTSYVLCGLRNDKLKSAIRLLCANKLSFCHLPFRFSVTMESYCALKT